MYFVEKCLYFRKMQTVAVLFLVFCCSCAVSGKCYEGWTKHEGSCYIFSDHKLSWAEAQALCVSYNGALAVVETSEENEFLKATATSKGEENFYIGGSDLLIEGNWTWIGTGDPVSFDDWGPGQPSNTNEKEHCLTLWKSGGYKWNDLSCGFKCNFICEAGEMNAPRIYEVQ